MEPGGSPAAPRVIAHRGASARWPEHSRPAYTQALADGADGLECDVRLTADDVPICWHDADLDRTSDATGAVRSHTLADLRSVRLRGGTSPRTVRGVLTVAELLDLALGAERPVRLAIELKHPAPYGFAAEDAVLDLLEDAGWDPATGRVGAVVVSLMSFHPGSLKHLLGRVPAAHLMVLLDDVDVRAAVAEHAPARLPTSLVVAALRRLQRQAERLADDAVVGGVGPSVAFLAAHPERVNRWHADGALVRVWTVDEPVDLELCLAHGIDEVTTNVPDRLLGLLGRPGRGTSGP